MSNLDRIHKSFIDLFNQILTNYDNLIRADAKLQLSKGTEIIKTVLGTSFIHYTIRTPDPCTASDFANDSIIIEIDSEHFKQMTKDLNALFNVQCLTSNVQPPL